MMVRKRLRAWDLAASKKNRKNVPNKRDWVAGTRLARTHDNLADVEDVVRFQGTPLEVEQRIRATAELDGREVPILIEREPGSSGVIATDHYIRNVLPGFNVRERAPTGQKSVRFDPFASYAEAGNVRLVRAPWNKEYVEELELAFGPSGVHDDQADSSSAAFGELFVDLRPRAVLV